MNRFFLSDHHLGQDSIYTFVDDDGDLIRPWATSSAEADEMIIDAHNAIVGPRDTTYFLGDVVIKAKSLPLLGRMNGRKILIKGNHDVFKMKQYAEYFEDLRGEHKIDRLVLMHRPMHPDCISHWCLGNVHGHIHQRDVKTIEGAKDPRYLNLSIEKVGLSPLPYEELVSRLLKQRPEFEARIAAGKTHEPPPPITQVGRGLSCR